MHRKQSGHSQCSRQAIIFSVSPCRPTQHRCQYLLQVSHFMDSSPSMYSFHGQYANSVMLDDVAELSDFAGLLIAFS